jgi:hypothetical protein
MAARLRHANTMLVAYLFDMNQGIYTSSPS